MQTSVSAQALATDKIAYAQQLAAKLAAGGKSHVLRLDGLVDVATLRNDDSERQEVCCKGAFVGLHARLSIYGQHC